MSSNNGPRSGYTAIQIQKFYDRISLPQKYRHEPGPASSKIAFSVDTGLEFLSALQRYSLSSIPFENLDLHYSTHHSISIDPEHLFEKIVERKNGKGGRGGYCMENNAVFANVLRGLGFHVVSTGARISSSVSGPPKPLSEVKFSGWSHMLNLVSFKGTHVKYLVDIGFGSGGATRPIPLVHDEKGSLNVGPDQSSRLLHASIPGTVANQKMWVYEKRNGVEEPFSPCYSFGETEFLESDFVVMNHWTSTSRTSWFTHSPVCVKMVLDESGEKVIGNIQIFKSDFKKRINGKSETPMELKTEKDRVFALEKYFGLSLDINERKGINGMVSALALE